MLVAVMEQGWALRRQGFMELISLIDLGNNPFRVLGIVLFTDSFLSSYKDVALPNDGESGSETRYLLWASYIQESANHETPCLSISAIPPWLYWSFSTRNTNKTQTPKLLNRLECRTHRGLCASTCRRWGHRSRPFPFVSASHVLFQLFLLTPGQPF